MYRINNQKGVAMIVAVVMALIFFVLVLSVTAVSNSAYRRSHFYKDRAIALNLAEAGIADALYRMNYVNYVGATGSYSVTFPFTESDTLVDGGSYNISFSSSPSDALTSVGSFKGRQRTIEVGVRGATSGTNGIAEAFNKHAIYAEDVGGTETSITGNIARVTVANISSASDNYSVTTVASTLFDVPSFPWASVDDTAAPGDATWANPGQFKDNDGSEPYVAAGGYHGLVPGLSYAATGGVETYTFNNATITQFLCEEASADTGLAVVVTGSGTVMTSASFLRAKKATGGTANITLDFSTDNLDILGVIKADTNININSGVSSPTIEESGNTDTVLYAGGNIDIPDGFTVYGDVIAAGTVTLRGPTIRGSVLSNTNIDFLTAASAIYGNPGASAVITIRNSSSDITLTIPDTNSPNIYLDPDNDTGIVAYSSVGATTVNVNADFPAALNPGQAGIIAYAATDARVNIGSAGTDVDVNGLIYSYGGTSGNITLGATKTGTVTGALVAGVGTNSTVDLNGGTLIWDKRNYVDTTDVFWGFSGGRRVYLPVAESWREE